MTRYMRGSGLVLGLALLVAACAGDGNGTGGGSPSPSPTEISTYSIAECQTEQGTTPYADPRGVSYNAQLREQGVLHVGSDNDYPPFEQVEPGAEEPTGFDVDLYTEVAERLGLEARSTTTSFDGLFSDTIPSGRFDIGVSAITISEERKQSVDFTIPYFQADLSLAVNTELTPEIAGVDDLEDITLGAQQGTTGEACAQFMEKQGMAADVRSYESSSPMFEGLSNGQVGAVVNDRPASEGFIRGNAALSVVQVIETREQYGFAISKDKPDLRVAINEALTEIMEDGTYAQIYEKWFETPPPYDVPIS